MLEASRLFILMVEMWVPSLRYRIQGLGPS